MIVFDDHRPPDIKQPRHQWPFFILPVILMMLLLFWAPSQNIRLFALDKLCFAIPTRWLVNSTSPTQLSNAPINPNIRDYLLRLQNNLGDDLSIEWVADSNIPNSVLFISIWQYHSDDILTYVGRQATVIGRDVDIRITGDSRITIGDWRARRIDFRRMSNTTSYRIVWLGIDAPINKLIIIEGLENSYRSEELAIGAWLQSFASSC